ncbi:hypothetical protein Bca4012_052639 [Brassica carinata]
MVFIARPQADKPPFPEPSSTIYPLRPDEDACDDKGLPFWPTDFEDTTRFYWYTISLLESEDWIRLYLEIALCSNDRNIPESHLSKLQIVRVARERSPIEHVGEDGEHVERRVIIRRYVDLSTGYFTLMGGFGFSKRLYPTTPPCPAIPIADWWKS